MSAATHTYNHGHVHMPAAWIVWLITAVAVILLALAVVAREVSGCASRRPARRVDSFQEA